MEVKNYIRHPALQEYIFSISTVNFRLPVETRDVVSPYPPTPFQSLMFYCNNPISMGKPGQGYFGLQPLSVVIGPQYSRVNIKVHDHLRAIRVDLLPGGMYRLLGTPMHEHFDDGFNARDIFGVDMRILNDQLQHILDLEEGKDLVEKFLLSRVKDLKEKLPFDSAIQILFRAQGKMSMEETAALSCLSLRQFERKCQERLGMNPKLFARILKFSKAYRLHEALPQQSWISIAHQAGYYDQMHMIKDFKVFTGVNPSEIEQELRATSIKMQRDIPV